MASNEMHLHTWAGRHRQSLCGAQLSNNVGSIHFTRQEWEDTIPNYCASCVERIPLAQLADTDLLGSKDPEDSRGPGVTRNPFGRIRYMTIV